MQSPSIAISPTFRGLLVVALRLLVVVALASVADLLFGLFPPNFGDLRWRYELMRLFLSTATQAGLFVSLFMALGTIVDYRLTVRVAAIVALVLGVTYLLVLPFYGLDHVVARRMIAIDTRHSFDMLWARTSGYVVVMAIGLILAGVAGVKGTPKPDANKKRELGEGLVVGQG